MLFFYKFGRHKYLELHFNNQKHIGPAFDPIPVSTSLSDETYRRMADNGFAPHPREFCRHILSCRELKAKYFKRCLHSVLQGVSL